VTAWAEGRAHHGCFLSYSRKNEDIRQLRRALTRRNIPSWFAPLELRSERELERDLKSFVDTAERFVVVISVDSAQSSWVAQEVEWAMASERTGRTTIIPMLLEVPIAGMSPAAWPEQLVPRVRSSLRMADTPGTSGFEHAVDLLALALARTPGEAAHRRQAPRDR
jgi:hypothetical protein